MEQKLLLNALLVHLVLTLLSPQIHVRCAPQEIMKSIELLVISALQELSPLEMLQAVVPPVKLVPLDKMEPVSNVLVERSHSFKAPRIAFHVHQIPLI